MKKLLLTFALLLTGLINLASAQTLPDLNGVTFGFGAGYGYSFNKTYDYSLTTDGNHNLILQPLNKQSFVVSSVIMVKLGQLAIDPSTNTLIKRAKKTEYVTMKKANSDKIKTLQLQLSDLTQRSKSAPTDTSIKRKLSDTKLQLSAIQENSTDVAKPSFWDHLSINASLDLANVSPNVSFNKNVNGGLGIGYFFTDNLQVALFYDLSSISQLRDYIVNTYQNKSIPNGSGTNYNSLDASDNSLFYNKTVSGLSFKLIFSLGNQKATSQPSGN